MPPAGVPSVSTPWTAGPAGRDDVVGARWIRILWCIAALLLLAVLALLVIAIADVQVAGRREAVELDLTAARSAAALVPRHLAAGDADGVGIDLQNLSRASAAARRGSGGFLWALAGLVSPDGGRLAAIRRDVRHSAALAAAADPLRRALIPLTEDAGAAEAGAGPAELARLDDLARELGGYAGTAVQVGDPSGPALERAAMVAGLLPALAGAEASRTWTICRTTTGPCVSTTLASGVLGPIATTPAGPLQTHDSDLLIVGQDWATLFRVTGVFQLTGAPRYLRMPVMFGLLYGLGSADDGRAQVTVHSVVQVEQQTIERLNRPSF